MEEKSLKEKLKDKIGRDSFKEFWKTHLIGTIDYQYFINQLNGGFRLDAEVQEIIEKYIEG